MEPIRSSLGATAAGGYVQIYIGGGTSEASGTGRNIVTTKKTYKYHIPTGYTQSRPALLGHQSRVGLITIEVLGAEVWQ